MLLYSLQINHNSINLPSFRINAIESELKHTQTANGQMKKDVTQLKQVREFCISII